MQLNRSCATCRFSLFDVKGKLNCHLTPPPHTAVNDYDWCRQWERPESADKKRKEQHEKLMQQMRDEAEEAKRAKAEASRQAKKEKEKSDADNDSTGNAAE